MRVVAYLFNILLFLLAFAISLAGAVADYSPALQRIVGLSFYILACIALGNLVVLVVSQLCKSRVLLVIACFLNAVLITTGVIAVFGSLTGSLPPELIMLAPIGIVTIWTIAENLTPE